MLAQDQREQARKLFTYLDTQTTAIADTVYRNEVADYTCRMQFARERELFFKRGPLFVGLSCLLPRAGDYMTHDYAGVPMLLVRHKDGDLRAFLNVCRHPWRPGRRRVRPRCEAVSLPLSRLGLRDRRPTHCAA